MGSTGMDDVGAAGVARGLKQNSVLNELESVALQRFPSSPPSDPIRFIAFFHPFLPAHAQTWVQLHS